jgi:hypothetical protein
VKNAAPCRGTDGSNPSPSSGESYKPDSREQTGAVRSPIDIASTTLSREQFADGADADQGGRFKILDSRGDLRALARQVEMIEGFARRQLVRVGQLVCRKRRTTPLASQSVLRGPSHR